MDQRRARQLRRQEERARVAELAAEIRAARNERIQRRIELFPERSRRSREAWVRRKVLAARDIFVDREQTARTVQGRKVLSALMLENEPSWKAFRALASEHTSDGALIRNIWMSPKMGKK